MILTEAKKYYLELQEDELRVLFSVFSKISNHIKRPGFIKKLYFSEEEIELINIVENGYRGLQEDSDGET